jgi:hypothetical protein
VGVVKWWAITDLLDCGLVIVQSEWKTKTHHITLARKIHIDGPRRHA